MVVQECIRALIEGHGISGEQAAGAMEELMTGEASPAQIGAYLALLRARGETAEVIAASARVMQAHAEPVPVTGVIDIVGTGGDGADTFNVSTAAAIVCAAAGAKVAKHGNRAMSSRCGSADILEALGAKIDVGPYEAAKVLKQAGFVFLFAQRYHTAMKNVAGPRRELGVRTIFNVLGPLTNPAGPERQLTGVGDRKLAPIVAEALALKGVERAMVVCSEDGLDEISPAGKTTAWIIEAGDIKERHLSAHDFDLQAHTLAEVAGGDADDNAAHLRALLDGAEGPVTDFVLMNAAAGCYVAGLAESLTDGVMLARSVIASGKARDVLETYIAASNEAAGG